MNEAFLVAKCDELRKKIAEAASAAEAYRLVCELARIEDILSRID